MNVRSKSYIGKGLLFTLMLLMVFTFASCGSKTTTLEKYISDNSDSTVQKEIDAIATDNDYTVEIKDDEITYTYKYDKEMTDDEIKTEKEALETKIADSETVYTDLITKVKDETKLDSVKVIVKYVDSADKEVFKKEFK